MTAQNGAMLRIKIGDGSTPELFTIIGGMRVAAMRLVNRKLENPHVASGAWRSLQTDGGLRALSLSGSGIFTDDEAEELLRGHAFAGDAANYELSFGNGDKLQGAFLIAAYERTGEMNDAEQYKLTLESAGEVMFTAG